MQESVKHPAKKSCPLFRFHTTCIERLLKKKKDWAKCKKLPYRAEKFEKLVDMR